MVRVAASCLLAIAIVSSVTAHAAIYRWVDNQGRVHYTESPPPPGNKDRGTIVRTTRPATGAQESAKQRSSALQERLKSLRDTRTEKEKEASEQKAESERLAKNCAAAQGALAKLENRSLRRLTDAEGNVTALTEEERLKKMGEARKAIKENCK